MEFHEFGDLLPLDPLKEYRVAEHDRDVRGWRVVSSDGRGIGHVEQLLVDLGAMKVRHLDVRVDDEVLPGARHVLVPTGYARLDPVRWRVFVDNLHSTRVAALPPYPGGPVTRVVDADICRHFAAEIAINRSPSPLFLV